MRDIDSGDPDDFMNFPFCVELETDPDFPEEHHDLTAKAMHAIANMGGRVVASADDEDSLPGQGRLGF